MKLVERGLLNRAQPGTRRAVATFPSVTVLPDRSLIGVYRVGTVKDGPDGTPELRRSVDNGQTWSEPVSPFATTIGGKAGSLHVAYLTPLSGSDVIACGLWVDRQTYPGKPLFNPETEGCLPMAIVVADSHDLGQTWTPWRVVPVTDDVGPPSLTAPVLRLHDGTLIISIESNKNYEDRSTWYQKVVYVFSRDNGQTWSAPRTTCQDPTARIFHWDQRAAVLPDGRIVTFTWTFDRQTNLYLNIQRRFSTDGGRTWSEPVDLGVTDQASIPAVLPDGRIVLAWVDRYHTQSIRARLAASPDAMFPPETEVVLYSLEQQRSRDEGGVGGLLAEMRAWTYGLPFATALPNGEVMVVYYAGNEKATDIHWCRLALDK
jgi:hypothetical protein